MSNINSLVLRVEELMQQHRQLQQENQSLRGQIASLEQQLAEAPATSSETELNEADLQTLQRLNDLIDDNIGGQPQKELL